ncbi:MAG TPA: hypothetical protein DEB62_02005 [Vibrio sp.]|uniref:Uncharacterized protein n=1 Tax=Vibrio casei TaxID=673372 RepID=A0A368LL20_9VIBR|nr:hypothetical protein CIK83_02025 [Vibrio casei]HBV75173.1 hypothetical protein [Vibrio sp.]
MSTPPFRTHHSYTVVGFLLIYFYIIDINFHFSDGDLFAFLLAINSIRSIYHKLDRNNRIKSAVFLRWAAYMNILSSNI